MMSIRMRTSIRRCPADVKVRIATDERHHFWRESAAGDTLDGMVAPAGQMIVSILTQEHRYE